jgi:hypothetical protein
MLLAVAGQSEASFEADIAGVRVSSGIAFDGFDACAVSSPIRSLNDAATWASEWRSQGVLVDATRAVHIRATGALHRYDFAGLGTLHVDLGSGQAMAGSNVPVAALAEMLLGPGLLLLLAVSGVFALHASAISHGGRTMLLCGVSGSGKSTFARLASNLGAELLADDVAPCTIGHGTWLRPRFPQLKWAQPLAVADRCEPVAGIVFVERGAHPLALMPLSPVESRLRLIRHTVAARLFPSGLLAAHLDAVTEMAQSTATWRLQWPECSPGALPNQVAAALAELAQA